MLFDNRVIQTQGAYQVLAQRFEILFANGSAVHLHPVLRAGAPAPLLRAVCVDQRWLVFDLRRTCPGIEADLLPALDRDRPGVAWFALRKRNTSARQLADLVLKCASEAWWDQSTQVAA